MHYWAEENPFVVREQNFQVRWKLNIWAGIIGDQLIGPCVFPNRMTGENYVEFLTENLPDVLEDLSVKRCGFNMMEHHLIIVNMQDIIST